MTNFKSKNELLEINETEAVVPEEIDVNCSKSAQDLPMFLKKDISVIHMFQNNILIQEKSKRNNGISEYIQHLDDKNNEENKFEVLEDELNLQINHESQSISNKSSISRDKPGVMADSLRNKRLSIYSKSKKSYEGIKVKSKKKAKLYPGAKSDEKKVDEYIPSVSSLKYAPSASMNINPFSQMVINEVESEDESSPMGSQSELTEKFYRGGHSK